jgi:N-acyl amino acid synthase FeeM
METLAYRIASPSDFDAIHALNYETFVEEIPQHFTQCRASPGRPLPPENTYVVCISDTRLVGMVCGRCQRPFSLDLKLTDLDRWLPAHRKAVEVRLLAVRREWRKTAVFLGLMTFLSRHFMGQGCDLAFISGTVRELTLYRHLGFEPFGECIGTAGAPRPRHLGFLVQSAHQHPDPEDKH